MNQYTGKCLCGACCYIITGEKPKAMYLCHCSRCRKETGTIHGANVFFDNALLSWKSGENNITCFKLAGTKKQRAFCHICGSPLPRQEGDSQVILPAGTLDSDHSLEPTAHIYYASRSSWEDRLVDLKRFEELPSLVEPIDDQTAERKKRGAQIDSASEDSFPARDPPSATPMSGLVKNDP